MKYLPNDLIDDWECQNDVVAVDQNGEAKIMSYRGMSMNKFWEFEYKLIDRKIINPCEEIDNLLFAESDPVFEQEGIDKFREYLGKWNKRAKEIQQIIDNRYPLFKKG